jgi:hypothetical protein
MFAEKAVAQKAMAGPGVFGGAVRSHLITNGIERLII